LRHASLGGGSLPEQSDRHEGAPAPTDGLSRRLGVHRPRPSVRTDGRLLRPAGGWGRFAVSSPGRHLDHLAAAAFPEDAVDGTPGPRLNQMRGLYSVFQAA
jgi:hypothetical protein